MQRRSPNIWRRPRPRRCSRSSARASARTPPSRRRYKKIFAGPRWEALAKKGVVLVYEVSKRELPRWVGEQFARHGVKTTAEATRALIELVGDNLQELSSEIEKLSIWAGHDQIGQDEVELLVTARADVPPFVLTDAWGRRDVGAVLGACESILERSNRSGEAYMLVGRLAAHVRRVQSCQTLDLAGVRPREAAGELKMHPFAAEKAFAQSRNFSVEELREAIVRLADLDLALKGGSRLTSELELQRTLVAITKAQS